MKFNKDLLDKPWFAMTLAACAAVLFYMLLAHFSVFLGALHTVAGFLKPVLIGAVIAYVVNPLVSTLEDQLTGIVRRSSLRHTLSVVLALIIVVLALTVLMVALIPQIIESISTIFSNADSYARTARVLLSRLGIWASNMNFDISGLVHVGNDLLTSFTTSLPKNFTNILHTSVNIGMSFVNLLIGVIMAIYFLMGRDAVLAGLRRLLSAALPLEAYTELVGFARSCNEILIRYIAFDILDGIIVGVANWIFMLITRMPYAVLISVVVGVTNLAPTFGPVVGGVIAALILVLIKPIDALVFLVFTMVLQTLDGYIIKPKLFGDQLGVSAIWILISLIFFGRVFGVTGILLAIPIAAILDSVYESTLKRIETRKTEQDLEEDIPGDESLCE